MTATAELLDELRLLRAMGEEGRTAAAAALRTARLGRPENPSDAASGAAVPTPKDPMKDLLNQLDASIVAGGGASVFAPKPRGTLSAAAERRLEAWACETPRRHRNAPGTPPTNDEPKGFQR
jgi:hypothetical protein